MVLDRISKLKLRKCCDVGQNNVTPRVWIAPFFPSRKASAASAAGLFVLVCGGSACFGKRAPVVFWSDRVMQA